MFGRSPHSLHALCVKFNVFPSAVSVGGIVGGAVGGIAFLTLWVTLFGVCIFVAYKSKRSGTAANATASNAGLPPLYPIATEIY
jgi:hypothetical protein